MLEDITDYFVTIIKDNPTKDTAEREFARAIADDPELRATYREWCQEQGTTERRGFVEFYDEYVDGQNEVWDSLTDYDNDEF